MIRFLKNNPVLALGAALPLVMLLVFWLVTWIPKISVEDPRYDFFFAYYDYNSPSHGVEVTFLVKNGILTAECRKEHRRNYQLKLYRFNAKRQSIELVPVIVPAVKDLTPEWQDLENFNKKKIMLDTSGVSPDGYRLVHSSYRSRGLAGELFGGGYRAKSHALYKDGRRIAIKHPDIKPYRNIVFLGWVKADGESQ